MALARTQCQNAADVGAMAARPPAQRRRGQQQQLRRRRARPPRRPPPPTRSSTHAVTAAEVTTEVGYYAYNSTAAALRGRLHRQQAGQRELVGGAGDGQRQPADVLRQGAGHQRPDGRRRRRRRSTARDIAMVLDFSGSMKYSSEPAYPVQRRHHRARSTPTRCTRSSATGRRMSERHAADDRLRRRRRRGARAQQPDDGDGQRPGDRARLPDERRHAAT